MKTQWISWLATIPMILFLTACGGGGGGASAGGGGGSYSASTVSWRIPDTGQNLCYYDYTIDGIFNPAEFTCLAPGSGWSPDGQDGYYSINAMSFTDNGNGTILDNVTGLTWQKCSLGESGSGCSTGSPTSLGWSAAVSQCANLGAGWRLPTVFELTRIVNFGASLGTIDPNAFPGTAASNYWSSTAHATYTGYAWVVNFAQGNTWIGYQTDMNHVRCVRG